MDFGACRPFTPEGWRLLQQSASTSASIPIATPSASPSSTPNVPVGLLSSLRDGDWREGRRGGAEGDGEWVSVEEEKHAWDSFLDGGDNW